MVDHHTDKKGSRMGFLFYDLVRYISSFYIKQPYSANHITFSSSYKVYPSINKPLHFKGSTQIVGQSYSFLNTSGEISLAFSFSLPLLDMYVYFTYLGRWQ